MKVRITKCSGPSFWYKGCIGQTFEVIEAKYTMCYVLIDYPSSLIRKEDCVVIEKDGYTFRPVNEFVEAGIQALADFNKKSALPPIVIGGIEYDLVERVKEAPVPPLVKEPELNTFDDCFASIPTPWHLTETGMRSNQPFAGIVSSKYTLPSEKSAKQIQAAIKLFVIQHALNGEEYPVSGTVDGYMVCWDSGLCIGARNYIGLSNPYVFKDKGTASKAIDIAEDIWLEYFGIK